MKLRKVVLDTNLYVDWLNRGAHEALFTGPGLIRYLPAVVHMELGVGAVTRKAQRDLGCLQAWQRVEQNLAFASSGKTPSRTRISMLARRRWRSL